MIFFHLFFSEYIDLHMLYGKKKSTLIFMLKNEMYRIQRFSLQKDTLNLVPYILQKHCSILNIL